MMPPSPVLGLGRKPQVGCVCNADCSHGCTCLSALRRYGKVKAQGNYLPRQCHFLLLPRGVGTWDLGLGTWERTGRDPLQSSSISPSHRSWAVKRRLKQTHLRVGLSWVLNVLTSSSQRLHRIRDADHHFVCPRPSTAL